MFILPSCVYIPTFNNFKSYSAELATLFSLVFVIYSWDIEWSGEDEGVVSTENRLSEKNYFSKKM